MVTTIEGFHCNVLTALWHGNGPCVFAVQESVEDVAEEDQEILPGGDPDAGMPTDQARIHGIERGPHMGEHRHVPEPDHDPETVSGVHVEDSLPVDVVHGTHGSGEGTNSHDLGTVTHPPDSD